MRTVSMPKNARPHAGAAQHKYRIACNDDDCGAVMDVRGDELTLGSDRDGSYAVMTCPHCGTETWLSTQALAERAKGGV